MQPAPVRAPAAHHSRRGYAPLAALIVVLALVANACGSNPSPAPTTVPPTGSASTAASPFASASTGEPTPVPTAPSGSGIPTGSGGSPCDASTLHAKVAAWDGATGHRIASVEMTNTGSASCDLAVLERPQLVDGSGTVLIDGAPPTSTQTISLAAGGTVHADVQAANYCGADPVAPVTVAFVLASGLGRVVADPVSASDTTGVPPCSADPGTLGSIEMMPWAP